MPIYRDENNNPVQAVSLPDDTAANHTALAISAVSASTAALAKGLYRVKSTVDCQVVQAATALTTHLPLAANQAEYFEINGVVSAIAAAAGTLTLTKVGG